MAVLRESGVLSRCLLFLGGGVTYTGDNLLYFGVGGVSVIMVVGENDIVLLSAIGEIELEGEVDVVTFS